MMFSVLLALACVPATAQQPADLVSNDQTGSTSASKKATAANDNNWHVGITPYLWFTGVHGTVGALNRAVGFHASIGDILSKFNIGFMGAVEARRKRILLPLDFMWIKLSDDKGIPLSPFPSITSIKVKVTQTVLTPKAGYRVVDHKKLKADGYVGLRYWHLGLNLSLQPSGLLIFNRSFRSPCPRNGILSSAGSPRSSTSRFPVFPRHRTPGTSFGSYNGLANG